MKALIRAIVNALANAGWRISNFFHPNREEKIVGAMEKVNCGGSMDDVDTIAADYFYLIKKVWEKDHPHTKPEKVEFTDNFMVVRMDGEEYNFLFCIPHNDGKATERRMEIEVLYEPEEMQDVVWSKVLKKMETDW